MTGNTPHWLTGLAGIAAIPLFIALMLLMLLAALTHRLLSGPEIDLDQETTASHRQQ